MNFANIRFEKQGVRFTGDTGHRLMKEQGKARLSACSQVSQANPVGDPTALCRVPGEAGWTAAQSAADLGTLGKKDGEKDVGV